MSATGPLISDAPVVRGVAANSAAVDKVPVGDRVVAIDGTAVTSFDDALRVLGRGRPATVTLERGEERIDLAFDLFADENDQYKVFFLGDEEVFTYRTQTLSGIPNARVGHVYAGRIEGSIALSRWQTKPNLLEVEISLAVPDDCADCQLADIYVMDWARRAWLSSVPMETVAFAVLPDLGAPDTPIAVPPPTVVGHNSYTR